MVFVNTNAIPFIYGVPYHERGCLSLTIMVFPIIEDVPHQLWCSLLTIYEALYSPWGLATSYTAPY